MWRKGWAWNSGKAYGGCGEGEGCGTVEIHTVGGCGGGEGRGAVERHTVDVEGGRGVGQWICT